MERVADYIFRFLADKGVGTVFVLTGNGAMHLNDAIAREPRLGYVCARHEAAAPMMASAYSRISGKLGVVCVTSGPGAMNAVSGLAEAWVDSAAVMVVSGQSPVDELPRSVGVSGLRTFGTAGIDAVSVVRPITKYSTTVLDPTRIRYELEKAYYCATSGRPGPVWIDIPMDVQSERIDASSLEAFAPPQAADDLDVSEKIDEIVRLLSEASRPLIIAGQGVRQDKADQLLSEVVGVLGIPVGLSRLAQDIFPRSMKHNLGQLGRRGATYSKVVLAEADFVLAIGCRLATQLAGNQLKHLSSDAKVVAIDLDENELDKFGDRLSVGMLFGARNFLERFLAAAIPESLVAWEDWARRCESLKLAGAIAQAAKPTRPFDLYYFMSELDKASSAGHILVTDAGSNYYVGGQVYDFEHGQREVTSGTFAAMGTSIPLGIGAAFGDREARVLAVTGDGSLELNIQELKTMSYYQVDMKLFVINNGGYVSMRNWQDDFFDGMRIGSDDDTGAEGLNLVAVADAFGLPYRLLDNPESLPSDLREIIASEGPLFVEVLCDSRQTIVQPYLETEVSS